MNPSTYLAPNFQYREFFSGSKSGVKIEPPPEYFESIQYIALQLQKIRDMLGKPIIITSGWRSVEHNKAIGGAKNSQHLYGKAADCHFLREGLVLPRVADMAERVGFRGIGIYRTFLHLDVRDKPARWNG